MKAIRAALLVGIIMNLLACVHKPSVPPEVDLRKPSSDLPIFCYVSLTNNETTRPFSQRIPWKTPTGESAAFLIRGGMMSAQVASLNDIQSTNGMLQNMGAMVAYATSDDKPGLKLSIATIVPQMGAPQNPVWRVLSSSRAGLARPGMGGTGTFQLYGFFESTSTETILINQVVGVTLSCDAPPVP